MLQTSEPDRKSLAGATTLPLSLLLVHALCPGPGVLVLVTGGSGVGSAISISRQPDADSVSSCANFTAPDTRPGFKAGKGLGVARSQLAYPVSQLSGLMEWVRTQPPTGPRKWHNLRKHAKTRHCTRSG